MSVNIYDSQTDELKQIAGDNRPVYVTQSEFNEMLENKSLVKYQRYSITDGVYKNNKIVKGLTNVTTESLLDDDVPNAIAVKELNQKVDTSINNQIVSGVTTGNNVENKYLSCVKVCNFYILSVELACTDTWTSQQALVIGLPSTPNKFNGALFDGSGGVYPIYKDPNTTTLNIRSKLPSVTTQIRGTIILY